MHHAPHLGRPTLRRRTLSVMGVCFLVFSGCGSAATDSSTAPAETSATTELGASGSCPVTVTVPSQNMSVGSSIQISVTQSCSGWTNSMIAYVDGMRCDDPSQGYPYPNAACRTSNGAQNFPFTSQNLWLRVTAGTHRLVVNNWNASGVIGSSTPIYFTYTPAGAGPIENVVAVAGDISCTGDPNDKTDAPHWNGGYGDPTNNWCMQKYTSDIAVSSIYNFAIIPGDLQYETGKPGYFSSYYGNTSINWGRLKAKTYPALGNHEYNDRYESPMGYFSYWGTSGNTTTKPGAQSEGYYFVDQGSWKLIFLNTSDRCQYVGCDTNSAQYAWLSNILSKNTKPCIAAVWHHPRYTSGEHAMEYTAHYQDPAYDERTLYKPFWDLLYKYKADIVLNGHDHDYERFPKMTSGGVRSSDGIREFLVGTGGRNFGGWPSLSSCPRCDDYISDFRSNDAFGVLKLTLRSNGYDWQFVSIKGQYQTNERIGHTPVPGNDAGSELCH